ncbi:MAG TPA: NAD(P)-dependent oxidoreductase [Streptosporangiaceae bacterium]
MPEPADGSPPVPDRGPDRVPASVPVGVLGAGRMGLPIVGHLARAGFPVTVYDPGPDRQDLIEGRGGRFAATAAEVAGASTVILICVGYEEQIDALLTGPDGLLPRLKPETVVAVLSTVAPDRVIELARAAQPFGVQVVDATVCRGGDAADRGELLSFVGGPPAVVERITPVLRSYSSDVVRTGDVGSAQVAKAVNNLILWACLVADHEGLALAQRYGVDTAALRTALLGSSAANTALSNWGKQTMAWAEDDLKIVAEMAAAAGVALPQAGVNREICRSLKPRRYQLSEYGI